jgi:hypothetical protein
LAPSSRQLECWTPVRGRWARREAVEITESFNIYERTVVV